MKETAMSKGTQGFASMAPDKQRAIAVKGGKSAHRKGTAHEWTPEEAQAAGRKGGLARARNREAATRSVEFEAQSALLR